MRLHKHRYGKWGKVFTFGYRYKQNKVCEVCGKVRQRDAGYSPE